MAFVDYDMSILRDEILHRVVLIEALNDRNIDQPRALRFASANLSNLANWQFQKHCQPFPPLVQQLLPVDNHQRVDASPGNEPGGDSGSYRMRLARSQRRRHAS